MPFVCSICGEAAAQICARCTKDVCANHLCEKCLRCSDCCECEVTLDEPVVHPAEPVHVHPVESSPEPEVAFPPADAGPVMPDEGRGLAILHPSKDAPPLSDV